MPWQWMDLNGSKSRVRKRETKKIDGENTGEKNTRDEHMRHEIPRYWEEPYVCRNVR
jgi:hypothetical protein